MAGAMASAAAGNPSTEYDCIVLGAGIAGVTAARDLHRAGFRVLLVEGSNRIGGRMYSLKDFVRHPDHRAQAESFPLEAGAEYVHVGKKKRFPEFFAELERQGFVTEEYSKFSRNRLAFPDWKRNPKTLPRSLLRSLTLIPTVTLLSEIGDYDRPEDMPAGAFVATRGYTGKGVAMGRYTLSSHTPGELFDPAIDPDDEPLGARADTISAAGFQADGLPQQLFFETSEYKLGRPSPGGGFAVRPYDELPRAIAAELLDPTLNPAGHPGEILLEHRVTRVARRGRGLAVFAETPSGETRELHGKTAVSTFSVGMLDPVTGAGDAIFGDLLPAAKREALKSLRMGPITKLSLELKAAVWKHVEMTVLSHPRGLGRTFFSAFPDRPQGPFVLTGLFMNQDHRRLRDLDDLAAVQLVLDVLHDVFDRDGARWTPQTALVERAPGEPNFNRQDWERDPFARGGNSYVAFRPELDTAAVRRLRQTLRDPSPTLPLFWAGEATAPAYDPRYQPLAVHGAYRSGTGAAADVGEFLRGGRLRAPFRNAFALGQAEVAAAVVAAVEKPGPVRVHVTRDELRGVERYAVRRTGGDRDRAALELVRVGLYLHANDPKTVRVRDIERDPERALALDLGAVERERVEEEAEELTDGDVERLLRALLKRGLEVVS